MAPPRPPRFWRASGRNQAATCSCATPPPTSPPNSSSPRRAVAAPPVSTCPVMPHPVPDPSYVRPDYNASVMIEMIVKTANDRQDREDRDHSAGPANPSQLNSRLPPTPTPRHRRHRVRRSAVAQRRPHAAADLRAVAAACSRRNRNPRLNKPLPNKSLSTHSLHDLVFLRN